MFDSMPDDASTIVPEPPPEAEVVPDVSAETPAGVENERIAAGDVSAETFARTAAEASGDVSAETFARTAAEASGDEAGEEMVDGVPVLAQARPIAPAVPAALPAVQAVAVAATGFVAGAATIALVKRHSARKMARATRGGPRRAVDMLPIVGSRTFLVDVHLVAKPQE